MDLNFAPYIFALIPLITVIRKFFASIKLSFLHFGQQRGYLLTVSSLMRSRALLPPMGQIIQSLFPVIIISPFVNGFSSKCRMECHFWQKNTEVVLFSAPEGTHRFLLSGGRGCGLPTPPWRFLGAFASFFMPCWTFHARCAMMLRTLNGEAASP